MDDAYDNVMKNITKKTDTGEKKAKLGKDTTLTVMLKKLLADTYILALKTQGFHWNVTGRSFSELHGLFEVQYQELYTAGDEIAERVRALRLPAPSSFAQFARLASVREEETAPRAKEMVAALVADNEQVSRLARQVISAATEIDDIGTADLATRRVQAHDKAAWMLRATLEDDISQEAHA